MKREPEKKERKRKRHVLSASIKSKFSKSFLMGSRKPERHKAHTYKWIGRRRKRGEMSK